MKSDKSSDIKGINKKDVFDISIREVLAPYLHYAWLFIVVLQISLACAWLYLRYTIPRYSVNATMLIRSDTKGGTSGDPFADLALFKEGVNKQNEIQILRSRSMMARVVDSLDLQYSYFIAGNVKTTNIYHDAPFLLDFLSTPTKSIRFEIHFVNTTTFQIGENKEQYVLGQPVHYNGFHFRLSPRESIYSTTTYQDYIVQWLPRETAAMSTAGGLEVKPSADLSNMLTLTYVTENPKMGADIINTLMLEYNKAGIEDKNEINRNILAFIDDRLNIIERQLDSVEKDLQRFKVDNRVVSLEGQSEVFFGNMVQTNQAIREQEVQLEIIRLLQNYLNDGNKKFTLVPTTLGIQDLTLIELTAAYNKLIADRIQELQTGATVNSPAVKNLEQDIESARIKLLQTLENLKVGNQTKITSLQLQNNEWNKEIGSIPGKEREARERSRQQEIKQSLYLYLLQKKEESAIAEASTVGNSRVIDAALPLQFRVAPIPNRIYGIAALAGIVVPFIIVYLIIMMNDKVNSRTDITKVTDVPLVGEIGHSKGSQVLLFPEKSRTVVAEQIRILRSNLNFIIGDKGGKSVILVTSSFSGEGKSFITTNLGAALALSGKRTVILEFDLRKPKIFTGLGLGKEAGLTNYLVGGVKREELPHSVAQIEGLYAIACGPVPPNPAEMLLSPKVTELMDWLRTQFDVVVIDSAPVGLVSDAITLSRFADATLYVVRQRYTFKRQLQFVNDLYTTQKLPHMSIVVNDVIVKGAIGYGYGGGGYGYGYGYGNGLGKSNGYYDEERLSAWQKVKRSLLGKR